jgi:hypothetical protein
MTRPSAPAIEDPDALANGQRFLDAHPELLPGVNALAAAQVTMNLPADVVEIDATAGGGYDHRPPKPTRAPAVKGRCSNAGCGKYFSAHRMYDGEAFCFKDSEKVFTPGDAPAQKEAAQEPIYIELPALRFDVSTALGRDMLSRLVASGANFASGMDWSIMEQLIAHIDRLRGAQ